MKDTTKHWYIATGAGLGIVFGYALLSPSLGLVLGAVVGAIAFRIRNKNHSEEASK